MKKLGLEHLQTHLPNHQLVELSHIQIFVNDMMYTFRRYLQSLSYFIQFQLTVIQYHFVHFFEVFVGNNLFWAFTEFTVFGAHLI